MKVEVRKGDSITVYMREDVPDLYDAASILSSVRRASFSSNITILQFVIEAGLGEPEEFQFMSGAIDLRKKPLTLQQIRRSPDGYLKLIAIHHTRYFPVKFNVSRCQFPEISCVAPNQI